MTIWRVGIACWVSKGTSTHSKYVIPIFHGNSDFLNAAHFYVVRTLPVLFISHCNKWKPSSEFDDATGLLKTASTNTAVKQKLHFEMPVTKLSAGQAGFDRAQSLHADGFASLSVMKS
jgi:hypothetical protein